MIDGKLATDIINHGQLFNHFKHKLESLGIQHGENLNRLILNDENASIKNLEIQQIILSECPNAYIAATYHHLLSQHGYATNGWNSFM